VSPGIEVIEAWLKESENTVPDDLGGEFERAFQEELRRMARARKCNYCGVARHKVNRCTNCGAPATPDPVQLDVRGSTGGPR
jgi:hypothetical protein